MEIDWGGRSVETPELTINYARAGKGAGECNRGRYPDQPAAADENARNPPGVAHTAATTSALRSTMKLA